VSLTHYLVIRDSGTLICWQSSFVLLLFMLQTSEEGQKLRLYGKEHSSLSIYADEGKVVQLLSEIEELVMLVGG